MENIYPANPVAVPADYTEPGKSYRQRAWLAMVMLLVYPAVSVYQWLVCLDCLAAAGSRIWRGRWCFCRFSGGRRCGIPGGIHAQGAVLCEAWQ